MPMVFMDTRRAEAVNRNLKLKFHGRVLDQLGFQTYQSRPASLAELVANAWDADATRVEITLPPGTGPESEIVVEDNGCGMTFEECQDKYLNIGYDRRGGNPEATTPGKRPVMGRKGIGKLAGFGIARKVVVETVSKETGEATRFEMDMDKIGAGEYVGGEKSIRATVTGPSRGMRGKHGTRVTLKNMSYKRNISATALPASLARRFLVHRTKGFSIRVNGRPIPKTDVLDDVEFEFPRDYEHVPDGTERGRDGWGEDALPNGKKVKWRVCFAKTPIPDEDLRGVAVFANGKMVQNPFFFRLARGASGLHGQAYMFGQVQADFVDRLGTDTTSTERQRVHWELEETEPLLEWGRAKVKGLLRAWSDMRGRQKRDLLDRKVKGFKARLDRLPESESRTVRQVLIKIGGIASMEQDKYQEVAELVLSSWENGRLKGLWESLARDDDMSEGDLLKILTETDILTALNVAEAIKTKLYAIESLQSRIKRRALEESVRDHLAANPWIIGPRWDTFAVEKRVTTVIRKQAKKAGLSGVKERFDLALSSGNQLLILEMMRPGKRLDWDHVDRCVRYVQMISTALETDERFESYHGYIIADQIDKSPALQGHLRKLRDRGITVRRWSDLLDEAKTVWGEYLHILAERGKGDPRLARLVADGGGG